ncbi:cytochrome [Mycobacterium vulneris]|uniref:Steroid C26-monooxygenase n=1 Tax=Mycolicibacterium septicum DSM 44393 TaxID=1341646 RepID=A0A7X6RZK8_9MYCO|nr:MULTISPECIES: cytochrome P450 [Mycolicibacterium]MBX8689984.1 cytochrome P450 [Mycobacterium sp. 20091114027_K0903767]OCB48243.1 cytochrome [Mycolicibacterium vulneris]NKZ15773.1 cytochrome P450 [Mycolicibacterium septicum DSM 44393]OBK09308.1 cytochrome [Mycolicibacterium fortuitum]OBK61553.1 cytochrome [Mycolicibacterium fortuitum]
MTQMTVAASDATNAAYGMALEDIDVSNPVLFRDNTWHPYFKRLREEDPVHYCKSSMFGPYWSVTKYRDIMAVETNPKVFSSEAKSGGITIMDDNAAASLPMFIAMDPPKHDVQRKTVSPIVAPENLATMESVIRQRTADLLDGLPINEEFDWVHRVSIDLTTKMLATLFDFPWDDRAKLTRWSDVTTALPGGGIIDSEEQRMAELMECATYFTELWNQRVNAEPKNDLISMMAHSESTRHMAPEEYLGNIVLLIVGGNDTTRNSMTGGVLALNEFPDEYRKLSANPALISSMVSEIIRWQTPLSHMRRTALEDIEFGGKHIRQGDKVVMWYVSGNRDPEAIDNPDTFIIDRAKPRQHLSFGFGIHRCVGNRLAELQLNILWEEILKRWPDPLQIQVLQEPTRVLSPFVKGYESLPVRINA